MAYIDRDKLIDKLEELQFNAPVMTPVMKIYNVIELVEDQPTADVVEVKRIEIIRDDLKWWLETNTEKGVVYIPKCVIENMIAKMDGERRDT